jgi:hypothetical protein
MDECLVKHAEKDVQLLADALRLSSHIVSKYPDMLIVNITACLLPYYEDHPKIKDLINQRDTAGLKATALMVPAYTSLHTPGGSLFYTLEGHPFAPFGMASTSDAAYLVTASNVLIA